jgi:hypothetical protein
MPALTNLGGQKYTATEETNQVDRRDTILAFSPNDGLLLQVRNSIAAGVPVYLKLRDSNDDPLPLDTELTFRFDAPQLDSPVVVSEILSNIRTYRQLSLTEQQNDEYIDQVAIEFEGLGVDVSQIEELELAIESSAQIDWTYSEAELDRKAVEIVSAGA